MYRKNNSSRRKQKRDIVFKPGWEGFGRRWRGHQGVIEYLGLLLAPSRKHEHSALRVHLEKGQSKPEGSIVRQEM